MHTVRLRPLASRPVSSGHGVTSRHDLSFGVHYDPARTAFGMLVADNDDVLDPGVGYGPHDHRDIGILTWVLAGAMRHRGPDGDEHVLAPGAVQRLSAGHGWHHDELNDSATEPLHLLQMWILPDAAPGAPVLEVADVAEELAAGDPVVLAGPGGRVGSGHTDALLTAVRLAPGAVHRSAAAHWVHATVSRGSVRVREAVVVRDDEPGDGVPGERGAGEGAACTGDVVEAQGAAVVVEAGDGGAEVLVWEMGDGSAPSW